MESRKLYFSVKLLFMLTSWLLTLFILAACTSSGETNGSNTNSNNSETDSIETGNKKLTAVKQVTNWFAEPEHGGQYAALAKGFYEEAGLDMTIEPGGPQVSSITQVSTGEAMFGMTQADDLLIARSQGIPIVAIAATFQTNPQGLIYHKSQGISHFSDLNGHTVYTAPGAGYWQYIKAKYELTNVKEMNYTGSLANFVNDPAAVTQGYITAEPFSLAEQGIETDILLNAESGYNPYANILYTTEETIKNHPDIVKAFVEASIKGWNYYKDNYEEINKFLLEYNPDLSIDLMKHGSEAQMDLVYGGDAEENGVGYMTEERWNLLMEQLLELKLISKKEDVKNVFTNEFLPSN